MRALLDWVGRGCVGQKGEACLDGIVKVRALLDWVVAEWIVRMRWDHSLVISVVWFHVTQSWPPAKRETLPRHKHFALLWTGTRAGIFISTALVQRGRRRRGTFQASIRYGHLAPWPGWKVGVGCGARREGTIVERAVCTR